MKSLKNRNYYSVVRAFEWKNKITIAENTLYLRKLSANSLLAYATRDLISDSFGFISTNVRWFF